MIVLTSTLLSVVPAFSQTEDTNTEQQQPQSQQPVPAMVGVNNSAAPGDTPYSPDSSGDRMVTPPPVSGQTYPMALSSQERSNYLRAGLSFTSAYSDNVLGGATTHPLSDISYSVAPVVGIDETTARAHVALTYAPGFTFYQRLSAYNEADQNASIQFQYRLSPHVTFSATDGFQKSSNVFNQPPDFANGVVSGGSQATNFSVIAPIADRLSNTGTAGLSYQFGLNDMIGGSGTFYNLHYPNPSQVPGLYDSSSQSGLAFYSRRITKGQYIGVTYGYQRLVAYPTGFNTETQTHAAFLFYSFAPTSSRFSLSFFGGPQYSDTIQPPSPISPLLSPEIKMWNPAGGASLGWQSRLTSLALSYTHIISGGSGLIGAVKLDSAMASARQRITRSLNASVSGGYSQNDVIGNAVGVTNGHSISGTTFLQQMIGEHLSVQLGYSRTYQSYSDVALISTNPNINREFVSISYQFARPLGR